MRIGFMRTMAAAATLCIVIPAAAQEGFDACAVFTHDDAKKVLGAEAAGEPVDPKVKRARMVPVCSYNGLKDGTRVAATATFKFGKTDEEVQRVFEDARMKFQTKPMLISGADAFWSSKTGEITLRKGRTWMTVAVGPQQLNLRDVNDARKLAEILARKL
ncbi:MAG TPA: hypothetical protein VM051_10910 [Usitatibacter sp.]|nr:hypothetical protein [Usitatibacter sp.]